MQRQEDVGVQGCNEGFGWMSRDGKMFVKIAYTKTRIVVMPATLQGELFAKYFNRHLTQRTCQ